MPTLLFVWTGFEGHFKDPPQIVPLLPCLLKRLGASGVILSPGVTFCLRGLIEDIR